LAIWPFCAVLEVLTAVFNPARLSLSDFVAARNCVTVSRSALTSSVLSFGAGTAATGTGAGANIGPSFATLSDPATAPKLAAIATQAARRPKRALLRGFMTISGPYVFLALSLETGAVRSAGSKVIFGSAF
jgi:hypothetical protein